MTDSGSTTDESGYATDNSCANLTTSQDSDGRLRPCQQLNSIKHQLETRKLLGNGLAKISDAVEDYGVGILENVSKEFGCGSQKVLATMKSNSPSVFLAVTMCEGSIEQNQPAEMTKKCLWSGSCSPSVSTPSISDLSRSISFSSATPSEFSGGSLSLSDCPLSCSRVTSTPFARSAALCTTIHQGKHIRQSFASFHNAESPYLTNASQPSSPRPCHRQQRNSSSSLGSFTSDYFSTSSIATLTKLSELQKTPGRPRNCSNSMSRGKVSKYLVWPPWMNTVDDAEHNPVQPLKLSCQSLPSDNDQLLKCSQSFSLSREKYLNNQEISTDAGQHSSYSSNMSSSFTTTELQSCSFPDLHTEHLLIRTVPEQCLQLKQYFRWKDEHLGSCGGKCTSSLHRIQNITNLEGVGELVTCSPVSRGAGSKVYKCLKPNPDLQSTNSSIIHNGSAPPTPPSNRLVRSVSSPNLSPQTSVTDASVEEQPSCQISTAMEDVFKSPSLLMPSADSQCAIRKCMHFSCSSFEIRDISELNHCGSILNNPNFLSHKFLSTPVLSPFKQAVEYSLHEIKIDHLNGETMISPDYIESSVDYPSNTTTAVTKPPISIDAGTNSPISIIDVTNPQISNDAVTKPPKHMAKLTNKSDSLVNASINVPRAEPPKHMDVVAKLTNKSDSLVNASINVSRAEAEIKHTSTDNNSEELYGTSFNHSEDSLILPCPDNCKMYPVSASFVLNSKRHPLNIAHAKRNLGLKDLQLKEEDCKTTAVEIYCSSHCMRSSSNYCNQDKFADENCSALPLLLGGRLVSPKLKLSKSGCPSEECSSLSVVPLQHTKNKEHHLSIPLSPFPSHLSSKPPIYPSVSPLVNSNSSCPNIILGTNNKQFECRSLLHKRCNTTTQSKITLPNDYLSSRRPCAAGREQGHQTFSQGKQKEHGGTNQSDRLFSHAKLDSENKLPKTQTGLLASRERKWPYQPPHCFSFLPLVTASPSVRRGSLSVVALLMEEAPYLLPVVLHYLGPRDLVAVTRVAKQLCLVVMETSSLHSKILKYKQAYAQSVRVMGKENISCLGKTGFSSGPAPRAALNQLNSFPGGHCVASVLQAGNQPPPRGRPQQGPLPTLTGRKEAKGSPRKILGAIQSAVSSLQAAISPNKAALRAHAAKAVKPLKGSKKLFSSGSGTAEGINNSFKSSSGDNKAPDKFPASPPCLCPQCLAASHRERSTASAAGGTSESLPCGGQLTGANGRITGDGSDQALDKTDGCVARYSRTADGSGSLVSSCSTNNFVFAKDDSPTKFSPIKLNIFAKSTKKRLRRL